MQQPPSGGPPPGPQFSPPGGYGAPPTGPPLGGSPPQGPAFGGPPAGPPSGPYGGPSQPVMPGGAGGVSKAARVGGAKSVALAGLGVVVVAGVAAGAYLAYSALHGKGDALTGMVPASADGYATIYLNPSASQKQNLDSLVPKFPAAGGQTSDQLINQQLDQVLKSSHLSFTGDVRPWLDSQVAVAVRVPADNNGSPKTAEALILASSKDDAAAQAFIAKAKTSQGGSATWTSVTHNGITEFVDTHGNAGEQTTYAVFDHAVVLGSSQKFVEDSIDTDKGAQPSLGAADAFKRTIATVPSDRLMLVYVNSGALLDRYSAAITKAAPGNDCLVSQISGFRGLALTVSADPQGIALDSNLDIDSSRVSAVTKASLGDNHTSAAFDYMPKSSFAGLGLTHLNDAINAAVSSCGSSAAVKKQLDDLGLTGGNGIVNHLTGDGGVTVGPGTAKGGIPTGALLLGTNDENAMKTFLGKLAAAGSSASGQLNTGAISGSSGSSSGSSGGSGLDTPFPAAFITGTNDTATDPGGSPIPTDSAGLAVPTDSFGFPLSPTDTPAPTAAAPQTTTHNGVAVTTITIGSLTSLGIAPSYAVVDNMGVVGLSPDEVNAVIDAHRAKDGLAATSAFTTAKGHLTSGDAVNLFVDVQAIADAVKTATKFDSSQVQPVKSVISGGQSGSDHMKSRIFVLIQ